MSQFLKLTGGISSDLVILLAIFFVFFFYTIYFGKNRTVSLILAYYPTLLLWNIFPFFAKLTFMDTPTLLTGSRVGIFLLFFIPLQIIINRYIVAESASGTSHILRTVGLSLSSFLLVLIFSYTIINVNIFHSFFAPIKIVFSTPERIFLTNLAPLVLLAFL